MLSFLKQYGGNVHSQNGEDLIIQEALRRILFEQADGYRYNGETGARFCSEIGGNDGRWLSNTCHLIEQGWHGLFVEAQYDLYLKCKENWKHNPNVRSQCSYVDERNINAFVDDKCDLLSLDTDGSDFKIFCGLKAQPKIVIVEIDSSLPPDKEVFNADGAAGYWAMTVAALERGFFVLCHTGNLVLLRQEYGHLFPEIDKHPLIDYEHFFNDAWLK